MSREQRLPLPALPALCLPYPASPCPAAACCPPPGKLQVSCRRWRLQLTLPYAACYRWLPAPALPYPALPYPPYPVILGAILQASKWRVFVPRKVLDATNSQKGTKRKAADTDGIEQ